MNCRVDGNSDNTPHHEQHTSHPSQHMVERPQDQLFNVAQSEQPALDPAIALVSDSSTDCIGRRPSNAASANSHPESGEGLCIDVPVYVPTVVGGTRHVGSRSDRASNDGNHVASFRKSSIRFEDVKGSDNVGMGATLAASLFHLIDNAGVRPTVICFHGQLKLCGVIISASFLAELSVSSPRKSFIFII